MSSNSKTIEIFLDRNGCDSFKVDDFITSVKKCTNLKIVLKELESYHEMLYRQINQHISKEYIDYIILSANIVDIGKYIQNMSTSLDKLENTIFEGKNNLGKTLLMLNDKMTKKNSVQKLKYLTKNVIHIFITFEKIRNVNPLLRNAFLIFLESEILNLAMIQLCLDENIFCKQLLQNKESDFENLKEVENKLRIYLIHFINENEFQNLFHVLHIYSVLNKRKEAETVIREMYVKTFILKYVTERDILQYGIVKVYGDVVNFVSQFCTNMELARQNIEMHADCLSDYEFIVEVFWIEILKQIASIIPVYITSPSGDAEKFYADYSATVAFLLQFEQCFVKFISIKCMREHNVYKTLIEKWNLEVYFKMRFVEIAGKFERTLLFQNQNKTFIKDENSHYLLMSSEVLIECVNLCWDDTIFLRPLYHEFWKLTLQLISRYNAWIFSYVKVCETKSMLIYEIAISIIMDIEQLIKDYEKLFNRVICSKIDKLYIESAFSDSVKLMKKTALQLEKSIVESLIKKICPHIASVTDIPRLYLKTNRDIPTTPSPYITAIRNLLSDFLNATDSFATKELQKSIINLVTASFYEKWLDSVHDAIMSVRKMEKSLKILKRVKSKPRVELKNNVSDEEKIKQQFMLDANAIEEFLESFGVENVENIARLKEFINS